MRGNLSSLAPAVPAEPAGWKRFGWELLIALAIIAVGTALRMITAVHNSAAPMIDENEIAEQAAAFLGPDLKFYFLKYGPLTMYAIAAIYRVAAALHGVTPLEYASRVFLDGAEHYAIARVYTIGWVSALALVSFLVLRRQLGARPAWLACALLAFPLIDVLAPGARIDAPQAAFQCLALLALTEVVTRPRWTTWLVAGACAGLGVATKPLPGLLIAPSFLLAVFFAASAAADPSARTLLARRGATAAAGGASLAALACVVCAIAGNPELLQIERFIDSQREAVALHSGNTLTAGTSIPKTFLTLHWPFVASAAVSSLALILLRDRRALVIVLFVSVYVGAFVGRQCRTYFMLAPAAALCLLIAYAWARAESVLPKRRVGRWLRWAVVPLAVVLIEQPARAHWRRSMRVSQVLEVSRWMETNVPNGTRIFHLGRRAYGTYLVQATEKMQLQWGEHFEYGRYRYRFLKEAFRLGYQKYVESGRPRYVIEVRPERAMARHTNRNQRWITDGLVRRAREKKQRYIIVTGFRERDVRDLEYKWFNQAILEMQTTGMAIFRVPDAPPPSEAASPPPPPVPAPTPEVTPAH